MKKLILFLIISSITTPIALSSTKKINLRASDLTFVDIQELKIFNILKKLERAKESDNQRLVKYYTKKAKKYLKVFESKDLSPGITEKLF